MLRRIVVTRHHEELRDAFVSRSFGPAGLSLETNVKVAGMEFDETLYPVRIPGGSAFRLDPRRAQGFDYEALRSPQSPTVYGIRAWFEDEEAILRLLHERGGEVLGTFADPRISTCPVYCGTGPVGTHGDVAARLNVNALRRAGLTGRGVRIAIVDNGIDGSLIPNVVGGWAPFPGYVPGSSAPDHGTMCAFDARISAPDADILDYALLKTTATALSTFLSDALAAFSDLIHRIGAQPGPLVVNNSWALFDRSEDDSIGSPGNYSANPNHPFNQVTATLVGAGADVCFAAGNCGQDCPDGRCGAGDTGPGASIHGANSHPDVITVAAVTIHDDRLGYSSQGPGALQSQKPDVCGFSHFRGSGVFAADGGTSAASPVVAGVVAALRQHARVAGLPPATVKGALQRTSTDLGAVGWDFDHGFGAVNAAAALAALQVPVPAVGGAVAASGEVQGDLIPSPLAPSPVVPIPNAA